MNIEPVASPIRGPRCGLAAAYKRFILKRIKPFLENNRHLNRNEVITDAIRLTWECSQKFKPELGFYFSTYLRHWLPNRPSRPLRNLKNQGRMRKSRTSSKPSPCNS